MLESITKNVKNTISSYRVVTPQQFNDIYIEESLKVGVPMEDITGICNMSDSFNEHCETLESNATNALQAIHEKDEKKLNVIKDDVSALKSEIAKLKNLVYEDGLTRVYNRVYLAEKVLIKNTMKSDGIIVIIDLNDLKYINDNIGHVAGDKVIMLLATKLAEISTEIIRYGGDEFLLFFHDENDIKKIYSEFHNQRKKLLSRLFKFQTHSFQISYSFAPMIYKKGQNFETVLETVDKHMYTDKQKNNKEMVHKIH